MCAATARPPRPARGPTRDPRSPPSRLRYVHSPAAGDSAAVAKYVADEAATADELPALLDGSSDEDEPGKPDFFVAFASQESRVGPHVRGQVCGQGPVGCRRLGTTRRNISRCARFSMGNSFCVVKT